MSDEHWPVDNGVDVDVDVDAAVVAEPVVGSGRWADEEACCSHSARVFGSTGQLEVDSSAFDVGSDGGVDEGSAGGSAFHHPMLCCREVR